MARPTALPGEAAHQAAADKFVNAADPTPVPPETPEVTVPDAAPPVLTLEDIIPIIPLPAQANEVIEDDDFHGPDLLDDIFGGVI